MNPGTKHRRRQGAVEPQPAMRSKELTPAEVFNMLTPAEAAGMPIPCQSYSRAGLRDERTPITVEQARELANGFVL